MVSKSPRHTAGTGGRGSATRAPRPCSVVASPRRAEVSGFTAGDQFWLNTGSATGTVGANALAFTHSAKRSCDVLGPAHQFLSELGAGVGVRQRGSRYSCGPTALLEPLPESALGYVMAFQGSHPLGTTTRVPTRTLRQPISKKACRTLTPEPCSLSPARPASVKTPQRRSVTRWAASGR